MMIKKVTKDKNVSHSTIQRLMSCSDICVDCMIRMVRLKRASDLLVGTSFVTHHKLTLF